MTEESFCIDTTFAFFANVLNRYTEGKYQGGFFPSEKVHVYPQTARKSERPFTIVIEGLYVLNGAVQLGKEVPLVEFKVTSLSDTRIKVVARCRALVAMNYFQELIAEIERCYPEVRDQRVAKARTEQLIKETDRELQEVVTDPLPLDMGIEAFKNWLIEYQVVQHPSSEPSVHYAPPDGNRVRLHYRFSDCWIDFEATVVEPGKLTITKMTCSPHYWKGYFERLIGAIPRRRPSTSLPQADIDAVVEQLTPAEDEEGKMGIFFAYAHEDEKLRDELQKHLSILERQGVTSWHDRKIGAGKEWEGEIDMHLNTARVILLLISSDFTDSDYCWDVEVKRAMERHEAGEARVIPIILRPVDDWKSAPFGRLQALPTDAKPVTTWTNQDEAFLDVAQGIRAAVTELRAEDNDSDPKS